MLIIFSERLNKYEKYRVIQKLQNNLVYNENIKSYLIYQVRF